MKKFEKASEEVVKLFNEVRDSTTIPHWIMFEVLCNNKLKELYKIIKMNDLVETLTDGLNFAVVFNEEIFDQLNDDQKKMALVECLSGVSVSESDAVSLEKPNFSTYRGVLQRYGHEPIIILHESVKSLFDAKKQKEDEIKAQTKGKRGRKKVFGS